MASAPDTFNPLIDRYDCQRAGRLFKSLWPDTTIVRGFAENLAASVRVAHNAAEGCWGVTMHARGIRLNVGQVETLTFWPEQARFFFQSPLSSELRQRFEVSESDRPFYASVPVLSGCCIVPMAELATVPAELREAHEKYIRAAACSKRVSPFKKSFSPAALDFIEGVLGHSLPRPSYTSDAAGLRIETLPDEVDPSQPLIEGACYPVVVNAFERNPKARSLCIAHYGSKYVICDFDFAAVYGAIGKGFIHVHHTKPLSEIGEAYEVDPVKDLRPVCPNCHAVIHLGGVCRSIDEVCKLIATIRPGR